MPGTNPTPDNTNLNTLCWVETDKVEFYKSATDDVSRLRSLAPWLVSTTTNGGYARHIYSYDDGENSWSIVGTNTGVIAKQVPYGSDTDITPLSATLNAIPNSLDSQYVALGNNPILTQNGTKTVEITLTGANFNGDTQVVISGVPGAVNGIPAAEINGTHTAIYATVNSFYIFTTTAATSSGIGGGAAVSCGTSNITVNALAHGIIFLSSDLEPRVKINSAVGFAGIPAGDINKEHFVFGVTANTFKINVATAGTSSVSGGGGAATTYQKAIAGGSQGISHASLATYVTPRIWSFGRFGNDLIMCAGDNTAIYIWTNSDITVAPTVLANAPTANWIFVSNNAVGALGANGKVNAIAVSDIGDATVWAPGPGNNAYYDEVENCGRLLSQAPSGNDNVLWSGNAAFLFRFSPATATWDIEDLQTSDGIIGPMARCSINTTITWVGQDDWYIYDGSRVTPIQGNTLKKWFYENYEANWKMFLRAVPKKNQIWVCFALNTGNELTEYEPTRYIIIDYVEGHFTLGKIRRTAAEEPTQIGLFPLMAGAPDAIYTTGVLYEHDQPEADVQYYDNEPDASGFSYAKSNYFMIGSGDTTMEIMEIVPDIFFFDGGLIQQTIETKDYPQSTETFSYGPFELADDTTFIDPQAAGRQARHIFQHEVVGGFPQVYHFSMGKMVQSVQSGPPL